MPAPDKVLLPELPLPPVDREAQRREESTARLRQKARDRAVDGVVFVSLNGSLWNLEVNNSGALVVVQVADTL